MALLPLTFGGNGAGFLFAIDGDESAQFPLHNLIGHGKGCQAPCPL